MTDREPTTAVISESPCFACMKVPASGGRCEKCGGTWALDELGTLQLERPQRDAALRRGFVKLTCICPGPCVVPGHYAKQQERRGVVSWWDDTVSPVGGASVEPRLVGSTLSKRGVGVTTPAGAGGAPDPARPAARRRPRLFRRAQRETGALPTRKGGGGRGLLSKARDRLASWLCNAILNHLATPWYRDMIDGSIRYGLAAAAVDAEANHV